MKTLIILLTGFTLFSCNKSEETEHQYNLDTGLEFSVFNSLNEDLLDPDTSGHLVESDIKLFYVINGKTKEVFNPRLDSPRNFHIYRHINEYRIGISLNDTETSIKPVTYIKWNSTDIDTIEVTYIRTYNAIMKNKVWFNGHLIWDRSLNQEEYYKIIK